MIYIGLSLRFNCIIYIKDCHLEQIYFADLEKHRNDRCDHNAALTKSKLCKNHHTCPV